MENTPPDSSASSYGSPIGLNLLDEDSPSEVSGESAAQSAAIRKLIVQFKWHKRLIWISVLVFVVSVTQLFLITIRSAGYTSLPTDQCERLAMAVSADGDKIALLASGESSCSLLISRDSGEHFLLVASLPDKSLTEHALTFTPDQKMLIFSDSPFIRFLVIDPGKYEGKKVALPVPSALFKYRYRPPKIVFRPNTSITYAFEAGEGLCRIDDWFTHELADYVDTLSETDIEDLAFNNTGTQMLLEKGSQFGLRFFTDFDSTEIKRYVSLRGHYSLFFDSAIQRWAIEKGGMLTSLTTDTGIVDKLESTYINRPGSTILQSPGGLWYSLYRDSITSFSSNFQPIDTQVLKYADEISCLGFQGSRLTDAIIKNGWGDLASNGIPERYYFYRRQASTWRLTPIAVKKVSSGLDDSLEKTACIYLIVSALLFVILAWLAYRIKEKADAEIKNNLGNNAFRPKSERPLGPSDADLLGFDDLADAVADLIRNPQTDLPFTIVISGSWGSGKSSMMNRIREKLHDKDKKDRLYYTTWFNAWHMQDERSLLDAFLLNLIDCYERRLPYILSPFRLTLAVKRFFRLNALNQLALGFTMALVTPFVVFGLLKVLVPAHIISDYFSFVDSYWEAQGRILSTDFKDFGLETFRPYTTVSAVFLGVFSLIFLSKKFTESGLGAFVKLLPKKPFNLDVESRATGYREDFKKEYWQIMDSSRKGSRMVVFIDDIDRIQGAKVLELLEAINFVSDTASLPEGISRRAPNTVFILGMFIQEVARNLGAQLAQSAMEGQPQPDKVSIGSHYIEKMVQMIIPVPFQESPSLKNLYSNSANRNESNEEQPSR